MSVSNTPIKLWQQHLVQTLLHDLFFYIILPYCNTKCRVIHSMYECFGMLLLMFLFCFDFFTRDMLRQSLITITSYSTLSNAILFALLLRSLHYLSISILVNSAFEAHKYQWTFMSTIQIVILFVLYYLASFKPYSSSHTE